MNNSFIDNLVEYNNINKVDYIIQNIKDGNNTLEYLKNDNKLNVHIRYVYN